MYVLITMKIVNLQIVKHVQISVKKPTFLTGQVHFNTVNLSFLKSLEKRNKNLI